MNNNQILVRKKGIAPIIATLLLILIAIAAAVIVYAYVVGFIGSSTGNNGGTQNVISIDQAVFSSKTSAFPVTVYVRNQGPAAESFNTGFFVKGSALNVQLGPAVSLVASSGTFTVTNLALAPAANGAGITVTVTGATCTGTGTLTASGFGNTTATIGTCATGAYTPNAQTLPLRPGVNITSTAVFTLNAALPSTTVGTSPTIVGFSLTAGSFSVNVNTFFGFTLSGNGVLSATSGTGLYVEPLSSGVTYTVQATGTDGATVYQSGKAS
jgi:archaeal type IV pilus assembly protein PilA